MARWKQDQLVKAIRKHEDLLLLKVSGFEKVRQLSNDGEVRYMSSGDTEFMRSCYLSSSTSWTIEAAIAAMYRYDGQQAGNYQVLTYYGKVLSPAPQKPKAKPAKKKVAKRKPKKMGR